MTDIILLLILIRQMAALVRRISAMFRFEIGFQLSANSSVTLAYKEQRGVTMAHERRSRGGSDPQKLRCGVFYSSVPHEMFDKKSTPVVAL